MLIYILEYILGQLELLSFNLLVNCIFNIQIFKFSNGLLIPLCEPFDIQIVDACDIDVKELCADIKWSEHNTHNLGNNHDILYVIHIKYKPFAAPAGNQIRKA